MNIKTIILTTTVALALNAVDGTAQGADPQRPREYSRFSIGVGGLGAKPQSAFGDLLDHAFGLGIDVRYRLDRGGRFALRLDGEVLNRGWGGPDVEVPSPVGGMRSVSLSTSNTVVLVQLGPELTMSWRSTRPYVGVGAGAAWFVTDASGYARDGQLGVSTMVWQQDVAFAFGGRAGVRVPLRGRTDLDLGVEYHHGTEADFVPEGDLGMDDAGGIVIRPVPTNADLLVFRAGISIALGRNRTPRG